MYSVIVRSGASDLLLFSLIISSIYEAPITRSQSKCQSRVGRFLEYLPGHLFSQYQPLCSGFAPISWRHQQRSQKSSWSAGCSAPLTSSLRLRLRPLPCTSCHAPRSRSRCRARLLHGASPGRGIGRRSEQEIRCTQTYTVVMIHDQLVGC